MDQDSPERRQSAAVPTLPQAREGEPDWEAMTAEELIAYQLVENRRRSSPEAQTITGTPDPGAAIEWRQIPLPGRELAVRVYRPHHPSPSPSPQHDLPLVLHVHGGGFVGTAVQSDWVNSRLATELHAVVVSVEHRLLALDAPLADAVEDGWDVLSHVVDRHAQWDIDPARVAVFGESCGALIVGLAAIRARETRLRLRAQVLVNPAVDLTATMLDYPSVAEHAQSPTLTVPQLRFFHRLAIPPGTEAGRFSPLYADLSFLPPTLVVVPTDDPISDQGRRYAERLQAAGTSAMLAEYPGAPHAFLSMPGIFPQAHRAQARIAEFLREALAA